MVSKAARFVEPCGEFVCQGFVLHEAAFARQLDGLFVEAHCVQFPAFEARNLGAYQRSAVCEC